MRDRQAVEKRNVTVHNRMTHLDAHTHIQRRKKNLMLLKCNIAGVERAVIPPKPSHTISDMDTQTALLYCAESMFTKVRLSRHAAPCRDMLHLVATASRMLHLVATRFN